MMCWSTPIQMEENAVEFGKMKPRHIVNQIAHWAYMAGRAHQTAPEPRPISEFKLLMDAKACIIDYWKADPLFVDDLIKYGQTLYELGSRQAQDRMTDHIKRVLDSIIG